MSVNDDALFRFIALFRGNETHYGEWHPKPDGSKLKGDTVKGALSTDRFKKHLAGKKPYLGIVPIMDDGFAYFGAIDYDDHDADLGEIAQKVEELGLPLIPCRSKSGGAHLYLFCAEPVKAGVIRIRLEEWSRLLQLENPSGTKLEIFPKQNSLASDKDEKLRGERRYGGWINLPYWNSKDTDRYAMREGEILDLEGFIEYAEEKRQTATMLKVFFPKFESEIGDEAPPCLQLIHAFGPGAEEKGNNFLFNMGVYFKNRDPETWEEDLKRYNNALDDPLSGPDFRSTTGSLDTTDYGYTCQQQPIMAHCNKPLCKKRQYGVGNFGKLKKGLSRIKVEQEKVHGDLPELTDLVKITSDPPRYRLNVNGEPVTLSTDEFLYVKSFQKRVFELVDIVFPILRQNDWQTIVTALSATMGKEDAPKEAGVFGMFQRHVETYLSMYRRSEGRESILKGLPVREKNVIYFRAADLYKYLVKEHNFRDYQPHRLWENLRRLGADNIESFKVCGKTISVWMVSADLANEQTEEFDSEPKSSAADF